MDAAGAPRRATAASAGSAPPPRRQCTYEEVGRAAFGPTGRLAVLISKWLYAGGCLVAYVVVVRDNFGPALRRMAIGPSSAPDRPGEDKGRGWLYDDDFLAFSISAMCMLPLSCPRTMKPLAKFSFVSILSVVFLAFAVVYLYFSCANPEGGVGGGESSSFYENWIEIRSFSGLVESLGCFVFTFVCHHTVNLAYESLPPPVRNPKIWRRVSTNSIAVALESSLAIGVFAYLTFGSATPADVVSLFTTGLANLSSSQEAHLSIDCTACGIPGRYYSCEYCTVAAVPVNDTDLPPSLPHLSRNGDTSARGRARILPPTGSGTLQRLSPHVEMRCLGGILRVEMRRLQRKTETADRSHARGY